MDYHPPNGSTRPSYKTKLRKMRKLVRRYVILNAALCDQVSETQEQLVIAKENRRFLLERIQRLSNTNQENIPQPSSKTANLNMPNIYASSSQVAIQSFLDEEDELNTMPLLGTSLPFSLTQPEPSGLPRRRPKPKKKPSLPPDFFYEPPPPIPLSAFPLTFRGLTVYSGGISNDFQTTVVNGVELLVPVNYHAIREYAMLSDPEKRCKYDCRVHTDYARTNRNFCQRFEIMSHEMDLPIGGPTADACHAALLRIINEAMGAQVITQLPKGEWFFGYALPDVRKHMKTSVMASSTDSEGCIIDEENDDTLHFEALQRSIAVARFEAQTSPNLPRADPTTPEPWDV